VIDSECKPDSHALAGADGEGEGEDEGQLCIHRNMIMGMMSDGPGEGFEGDDSLLFIMRHLVTYLADITDSEKMKMLKMSPPERTAALDARIDSVNVPQLKIILEEIGKPLRISHLLMPLADRFDPVPLLDRTTPNRSNLLNRVVNTILLDAIKICAYGCYSCLESFGGAHGANVSMMDMIARPKGQCEPSKLVDFGTTRMLTGWGDPALANGHRGLQNCEPGHYACNNRERKGRHQGPRGLLDKSEEQKPSNNSDDNDDDDDDDDDNEEDPSEKLWELYRLMPDLAHPPEDEVQFYSQRNRVMGMMSDGPGEGFEGDDSLLFIVRHLVTYLAAITETDKEGMLKMSPSDKSAALDARIDSVNVPQLKIILEEIGKPLRISHLLMPLADRFDPVPLLNHGTLNRSQGLNRVLNTILLDAIKICAYGCYSCLESFRGAHGPNVSMMDMIARPKGQRAPSSLTEFGTTRMITGWGDPTSDKGHRGLENCEPGHYACNNKERKGRHQGPRGLLYKSEKKQREGSSQE
jgi:hypothetical protein